jgi:hypothetical protein
MYFSPFKSPFHCLATHNQTFVDFVPVFYFCLDSNAMHYTPKDSPERLRRLYTQQGESFSVPSLAYGDQDPSLCYGEKNKILAFAHPELLPQDLALFHLCQLVLISGM